MEKDERLEIDIADLQSAIDASASMTAASTNTRSVSKPANQQAQEPTNDAPAPFKPVIKSIPPPKGRNFDFAPLNRPAAARPPVKRPTAPAPAEPETAMPDDSVTVRVSSKTETTKQSTPKPEQKIRTQSDTSSSKTMSSDEPKETPAIAREKRRHHSPSSDSARPPIPSSRVIRPHTPARLEAKEKEADDKSFTPVITPPKAKSAPAESLSMAEPAKSEHRAQNIVETPEQAKTTPAETIKKKETKKLDTIMEDRVEGQSGNMHDSENYQLPIKATRHHRKNDFFVWFFITLICFVIGAIIILLVIALIS